LRHTKLIFTLILGCAAGGVSVAQTEPKCAEIDKDCPRAEKVSSGEAKPSAVSVKFKTAKFLPDLSSAAIKEASLDPIYRPKPTPTPEVQTAAPAAPATNGSSPVDLITRVEMKYQFQNFASGYLHGVPIIRVDYAFSKAVGLRIDLPVLHFDSRVPGQPNASGIGDVVTSMTFVRMPSKRFIFGVVPRFDFPTASAAALGSGKYSFKPTLAGLTPLAPGLAFGTSLEYDVSFAGNKNRSDIHELSIKPLFLKSFLKGPLKGYYANPQLEVIVDFENNNRSTWQGAIHMGKILTRNVVVFVIPTVHLGGAKRESFKFEAGFRYLFR
jgi:hypothetical protein